MDLETFVSEALTQIANGIKTAQNKQGDSGAVFSPQYFTIDGAIKTVNSDGGPKDIDPFEQLEKVEFDIALTATDNSAGSVKAGLEVFNVSLLGAKGELSHKNESVSRVKFDVVVRWPKCVQSKNPR